MNLPTVRLDAPSGASRHLPRFAGEEGPPLSSLAKRGRGTGAAGGGGVPVRAALALALTLLLAACAPTTQGALRPPPGFAGPTFAGDALVSFDGARLGLSAWLPEGETRAVIVALHGMNDHSGAFWMAGPWWAERGVAVYAYDQRGFGRSPGRGVWPEREVLRRDLATAIALARARHPGVPVAVLGESMGGAVAIEALARPDAPRVDRVILAGPAVWGWSTQPWINRAGLWLGAHLFGDRAISPPRVFTRRIVASDNRPELRRMGRDPLMIWETRPDAVYGLVSLMEDARRDIGRVPAPVLFLYGEKDALIPKRPTRRAAAALKPGDRTAWYAEGWHVLLRDYGAETVWRDVEAFVTDPGAPLPSGAPPIPTEE